MNLTDEARASILTAPLAALTRARKMSDEEAEAEAAAEGGEGEDAEKANDDARKGEGRRQPQTKGADEASQHRRERPEGWRPKRLAAASAADARRLTRSSEGFTSLIMAAPALEPARRRYAKCCPPRALGALRGVVVRRATPGRGVGSPSKDARGGERLAARAVVAEIPGASRADAPDDDHGGGRGGVRSAGTGSRPRDRRGRERRSGRTTRRGRRRRRRRRRRTRMRWTRSERERRRRVKARATRSRIRDILSYTRFFGGASSSCGWRKYIVNERTQHDSRRRAVPRASRSAARFDVRRRSRSSHGGEWWW